MRHACCFILALLILPKVAAAEGKADAETFFELKIRPVLVDTCFKCHGGKKISNELRVDSREALVKGGESGPAIVPGEPAKSLLVKAIRHRDDELHMPPDKRLPDAVIADFEKWIKDGAVWPKQPAREWKSQETKHWAFEPVKKVSPPVDPSGWSNNPIDQFIAARLREHGLKPVESADKRTLIRRAYFDLIGLPPTPQEVQAFLEDRSAGAYARLVDRLLASPHYGERWGRHWMDVVRYADTAGDNADYPIPEIRLYRDYIIDSFNADKPYDQFVQEQIAGDILARQETGGLTPPAHQKYAEQVVATGFLALSRRYATAPYELWHLTMEDTIDTVGRAFLGLTLKCARCHDHKFDPVTKEDYYALYGFFASTQFPWTGAEELASKGFGRQHMVPLIPPAEAAPLIAGYQQKIKNMQVEIDKAEKEAPLTKRIAELKQQIEDKTAKIKKAESKKDEAAQLKGEVQVLTKEREKLAKELAKKIEQMKTRLKEFRRPGLPPEMPAAYAVWDGQPTDMYVHIRGEIDQHGPVVKRNVPKFLIGDKPLLIPKDGSGRLQLAQWLTGRDNPLTARVMVNRIWQHHFGKGIVTTPSNFGARGEPPSHPELLDWLAGRFVESGWSVKAMHRLVLLSKTYQLSSGVLRQGDGATGRRGDGEKGRRGDREVDLRPPVSHSPALPVPPSPPPNKWHWRFDRQRLDAESIRDAMLMLSGKLETSRPGPHPFPAIDKWGWTQHHPFKDVYPSNRRSVYLMTQRFQRHPYLALFDGPDTNASTEQRTVSTVPQQALFLMNSPFMQEQAEGLARRLIASSGDSKQRIDLAHQLAWARPANADELQRGVWHIEGCKKELGSTGMSGERLELETWMSYARVILCANEFVYVD